MEISEYKTMAQLEDRYWWYVGRRAIIQSVLSRHITSPVAHAVDLGCGTGANFHILKKFARNLTGLDTSEDAITFCRARGIYDVRLITDPYHLAIESGSLYLVTLFDVLEHIEHDSRALQELHRILRIKGLIAMTVPAYQFLWSEHDIALHHYRRYTLPNLTKRLKDAGFHIVQASYIISSTLPVIVLYRVLRGVMRRIFPKQPSSSHLVLPSFLNTLLTKVLILEAKLLSICSLPAGTSIVILAQKNDY